MLAQALVGRALSSCLLADKAYDSDEFRSALEIRGCSAVIPSKASRAQRMPFDKELYKARSTIECTFNLLKLARRFESPLRENTPQLPSRGSPRLRSALAANLGVSSLRSCEPA